MDDVPSALPAIIENAVQKSFRPNEGYEQVTFEPQQLIFTGVTHSTIKMYNEKELLE